MNYSKNIKEKNFVRLTLINWENRHWFILDENKDFLLIINNYDFILDWYSIINKDIIASKRYSKYEKFSEKLFTLNKIMVPKSIIRIDIPKLITNFKEKKEMISLEKYTKTKTHFELWIITKIWSDYLILKAISADWKREKEKKINESDWNILSRGNNYCKVYNILIK